MTSSTTKNNNKPLKWTTQRINTNKPTYRVNKRTALNNATRTATTTATTAAAAVLTAETEKKSHQEIERLQKELAFTYDTVATITVHFESLHHAYTCSKPELDKSKSATRLGEMEKELLTAYDDLGLQVTHLERKIAKLEKKIAQLKEIEAKKPTVKAEPVQTTSVQATPAPAPAPVPAPVPVPFQQYTSPLIYDELNLVSSPCSSTDSSISDCQLETSGFYCDDWALSQIIEDQSMLFNNFYQFMPINNNNNCMDYFNCEDLLAYPSFIMQ
ncbi:hypothetical protein INT46_007316 [Mucor plumbeus]|uniref:Uncharacterized protein n=1 Tax=Mucor plumbeus TaxID=97098 RepID=A0A8H7RDX7_9FUNG|nr:hypothetical protein INT46_007316 [Mucor plumbeus]